MLNHKILEALFVEATLGIVVANIEGEIVEANPFAHKLFGYNSGELLQKKVEELMPQAFRHRHVQHRQNYCKNPSPRVMGTELELYGLRKDASPFPIKISLSYTRVAEEMLAIAYISDDTLQQNMLQEIKQSKKRLDESQRLAQIGSFEVDVHTGEVSWSDEMYYIFGLSPDEDISYERYLTFLHPEDKEEVITNHKNIERQKKGINFGYRIITKEKGLRYVEGKREVKLDEKGDVLKYYGLLQDVTELREARSINEDISKIVEESLNEIYIFDAESLLFLQVNKGARLNIGYTEEEIAELTPIDIKPEFDEAVFLEKITPLKQNQASELIFETVHQRKDKSTYPVEIHLQISKIGTRAVFVAFVSDLSERKKYEQRILEYSEGLEQKIAERTTELKASETQLRAALEKEQELGELKSRFVSMASHEFRTPLSSILSSASLIGRYEKEEQQDRRMKHVNRIESSVQNLTVILNDFLSLEKLESGKVRYNPDEIQLEEYLQQILEEVAPTLKTGQSFHEDYQGVSTVVADKHLLKNVMLNLLSNAIKYSPENKSIEIIAKNVDGQLQIDVVDHGMGIPEENQKHLFTRFFRADNVTNIQGTGLGLTIIKRYIDLMGGTISFKSKEGEGSTFTITIPQG